MSESFYPEFIRNLPEADLPLEKVVGYLFQGARGQICFFDFEGNIEVPPHAHGNQWECFAPTRNIIFVIYKH